MWLEPKTNWQPTDFFQLDDWNRIVENAKFLYGFVSAGFEWKDCDLADTMALPYYNLVNNLESNLYQLSRSPNIVFIPYFKIQWYPRTASSYVRNPSYEDFNRWEQFEFDLNYWTTRYTQQLNFIAAGYMPAGNDRVRQYFSRRRNG